eukprot:COSAG06_NODE_4020_length_4654_cov_2.838419_2_plen_95_part_00
MYPPPRPAGTSLVGSVVAGKMRCPSARLSETAAPLLEQTGACRAGHELAPHGCASSSSSSPRPAVSSSSSATCSTLLIPAAAGSGGIVAASLMG